MPDPVGPGPRGSNLLMDLPYAEALMPSFQAVRRPDIAHELQNSALTIQFDRVRSIVRDHETRRHDPEKGVPEAQPDVGRILLFDRAVSALHATRRPRGPYHRGDPADRA